MHREVGRTSRPSSRKPAIGMIPMEPYCGEDMIEGSYSWDHHPLAFGPYAFENGKHALVPHRITFVDTVKVILMLQDAISNSDILESFELSQRASLGRALAQLHRLNANPVENPKYMYVPGSFCFEILLICICEIGVVIQRC